MKSIITSLICVFVINVSHAGEGMWIPLLLKSLNEAEMQEMGMQMKAEDIYSVNQGSLKDAIAHFGGFCTSELISSQGLLLTNHHCGYGQIQSHSSIDNNLLKNGFWAKSLDEELPNPGLFATFINEIIDVTDEALKGVNEKMSNSERQSAIDKNLEKIRANTKKGKFQEISIRPFYHGNQYFAFLTTKYNDVRLVGTPPESIGKFGADTDNWVWPRHTGDFSLFRIYAGPNNEPAEYSPNNKPYNPKHHLPISLDGVEEGDFTLVFGFPGRTQEYLPSYAIEQIVDVLNPAKIQIRETALDILDKYMRADEAIRIQYASKFARIANYWKKWIGESLGLKKTGGVEKKQKLEEEFMAALPKNSPYKSILDEFKTLYAQSGDLAYVRDYYSEVSGRNIELLSVAGITNRLVSTYENNGAEEYQAYKQRVVGYLEGFYKNYRPEIDQEVFDALTQMYVDNVEAKYVPQSLNAYLNKGKQLYASSAFTDKAKMMSILELDPAEAVKVLKLDPVYKLGADWKAVFDKNAAMPLSAIEYQQDSLQRLYMKALMETFPDKRFYPDANSTLRVTYGQVNGYSPVDAVNYNPVTYLDGIIEKYEPGDYEFDVDPKLLALYDNKDYGQYADTNGKVPICFIGTNHTTGGNSGSPAIDAHGNLIGLNFDRAWEGTMSDYNYDASICRNIMVDARYILFVVDKMAGASHLVEEMDLVHPKRKMKK